MTDDAAVVVFRLQRACTKHNLVHHRFVGVTPDSVKPSAIFSTKQPTQSTAREARVSRINLVSDDTSHTAH